MWKHFQPGEGPSWGLLRDCENWWIVCSSSRVPALKRKRTHDPERGKTWDNKLFMRLVISYLPPPTMRGSGWAGSSSKTGLFVRLGDKLYWVYVYVVRRWMLGFYIPLFYGDCTTQSLQSGFSQQIHISDLISSYFYLKLTQMLPFHHRLLGHDQENWG